MLHGRPTFASVLVGASQGKRAGLSFGRCVSASLLCFFFCFLVGFDEGSSSSSASSGVVFAAGVDIKGFPAGGPVRFLLREPDGAGDVIVIAFACVAAFDVGA